jgi:hypothetical protein
MVFCDTAAIFVVPPTPQPTAGATVKPKEKEYSGRFWWSQGDKQKEGRDCFK